MVPVRWTIWLNVCLPSKSLRLRGRCRNRFCSRYDKGLDDVSFVAIAWVCINPITTSCELMVVKTSFTTNAKCKPKLADMKVFLDKSKRIYRLVTYAVKPPKIKLNCGNPILNFLLICKKGGTTLMLFFNQFHSFSRPRSVVDYFLNRCLWAQTRKIYFLDPLVTATQLRDNSKTASKI